MTTPYDDSAGIVAQAGEAGLLLPPATAYRSRESLKAMTGTKR
jgi:hypothetical protein